MYCTSLPLITKLRAVRLEVCMQHVVTWLVHYYAMPRRQTITMKAIKREMALFDSNGKRGTCIQTSVLTLYRPPTVLSYVQSPLHTFPRNFPR